MDIDFILNAEEEHEFTPNREGTHCMQLIYMSLSERLVYICAQTEDHPIHIILKPEEGHY